MASARRSSAILGFIAAVLFTVAVGAEEQYKSPPDDVVRILDAPAPPTAVPSPAGDRMLLLDVETYPPIELLSRPFLRLAGVRIDPTLGARRREVRIRALRIQELRAGAAALRVELPADATIGALTWSNDGARLAFTRDLPDGVELWVCDVKSGQARPVPGLRLNDVLGSPLQWTRDNRTLLVRAIPRDRGASPVRDRIPTGPHIQETAGKQSRMATFQDLLTDAHDEDLFEHYATSQLVLVDSETGSAGNLGIPGLFSWAGFSPDGNYLFVERLERPFSYRVQYDDFAHSFELWSKDAQVLGTFAHQPISDEVPQQGVRTGVRNPEWQPLHPATLVWTEALDGGDPRAKATHRDRLMQLVVAPGNLSADRGRELLRLEERASGIQWCAKRDRALVSEYDRERRWTTTWHVDFAIAGGAPRRIFDRSINDAYADPGRPIQRVHAGGEVTLRQSGDFIFLAGRGATPAGDRPFVDRMNLRTLAKTRLFQSDAKSFESFLAFVTDSRIVTTHQSRTAPPNQFLVEVPKGKRTQLTDYRDPAPQITGIEKRLLKYHRADGTPLTAFLYLPPGYTAGTRLPVIAWAYPREFSDAGTAGQVRGSENTFVRLAGPSHLFFLTQGYAVLDDPSMPVLGDPETMNETYVDQIVGAAKAAVDTLVAMGIADPERIGVGGHSYGAFMTANLLAHCDLFAAGIARSGAYNRSLTPFGFQTERRSLWEAPELYLRMSPFTYANQINEPILMIHGEADTNSGTFPLQSERMFQALQGNGATARLVMLPFEGHGYRARESVLHTLAEMLAWADSHVKNRPAGKPPLLESRR